ncbi:MAG: esterase family protein [Acidimicrobiales bacterium]|nr:esterase family protein [Acidimicrobiales bacterium]
MARTRSTRRWVVPVVLLASCSGGGSLFSSGSAADPPTCGSVPSGRVVVEHLHSTATRGDERYRVYLPPASARRSGTALPLLVLLHGAGADDTQWTDVGIAAAADCLIAHHAIDPMVIALPDGSRVDHDRQGSPPPMERFVMRELIPTVARRHGLRVDRRTTRIGGISLGASWALRLAAANPDQLCAAGGHSPGVQLTADQRATLATHHVRVWLDYGADDSFGARAGPLATELRRSGVDVALHRWPGGHNRRYWSHHVEDYLRFYAHACPTADPASGP